MEIKIVIPTYKRAGNITTLKAISKAILCVTASEGPLYRERHPGVEIVEHPDTIVGLPLKWQWICDKFGDVLMVDDDIIFVRRLYPASGTKRAGMLTPDQAWAIAQWAGNTARLCGCYLFGFNKNPNPLIYNPFTPIMLSGMVQGGAIGLLSGSKITFTNDTVAADDFFIGCINAFHHRKSFVDMRFNFTPLETFKRAGGQSAHRTLETEKHDTLTLRRFFGDAITLKAEHFGGGRASTKNRNPYGRTIHIPF